MSQQSKQFLARNARLEMLPVSSVLPRSAVSAMLPIAQKAQPSSESSSFKENPSDKEFRFNHDFSQIPVHAVQRAATGGSQSLDESVRKSLEENLSYDFSHVRVHQGPASDFAAQHLGARAYTLGRDIYLGAEARNLNRTEHARLLAHEAVHTVQQGGVAVTPQGKLEVSRPTDPAEVEADTIARSAIRATGQKSSRSLAQRDQLRATPVPQSMISRVAAPLIQRDLKKDYKAKDGTFTLDLKTESHAGDKNGMSGTIKFNASDKAPDSTNIRLLQIVRNEDLTTGKEYVWSGDDADRNKMMTASNKARGIKPGFHVDVLHTPGKPTPRTSAGDPAVSPYYQDYVDKGSPAVNYSGSKKGKTIKEASLWDYPGSFGERRFSFETTAKAADTGYIFASIHWGFTISDASKGKVEKEHADVHRGQSTTFSAAVSEFNKFYKNPGASTAPK